MRSFKDFCPLKLIKRKIDLKLKLETLTKIEIFILQIINTIQSTYKKIPKDFFDLIIIDECHRSRHGDWGQI